MPSWNNEGDEFFRAAVFCHDSPKAAFANLVKCFGKINISRVEVGILFLNFLTTVSQQTQRQQSHVPYGNRIDSPGRVHVRDGFWGDSEGLWQGSCSRLIVKRFRGDYRMSLGSLSVYKYGRPRRLWSRIVVVLSPILAEWGSEVYP